MNNADRIILLQGVLNARELGGLPAGEGRVIKHGKIIRTGRLSNMTVEDRQLLTDKWHVTKIIDLRNNAEISEYPDLMLDGAEFRQVAIIPGEKEGISREDHGMNIVDRAISRAKSFAAGAGARALLESMYAQMAEDEFCVSKIKEFFDLVSEQEEGSFIWHCTSGKDRTGVTGVLLLYALGASLETAKEDYLYTNFQNQQYRENLLEMMREHGATEDLIHEIRVLESVDWAYIESYLSTVARLYGGLDAFLENQLGITSEKREMLIDKYTQAI